MLKLELEVHNKKIELPDSANTKDGDRVIVIIKESNDDFLDELYAWETMGFDELCNTLDKLENGSR